MHNNWEEGEGVKNKTNLNSCYQAQYVVFQIFVRHIDQPTATKDKAPYKLEGNDCNILVRITRLDLSRSCTYSFHGTTSRYTICHSEQGNIFSFADLHLPFKSTKCL